MEEFMPHDHHTLPIRDNKANGEDTGRGIPANATEDAAEETATEDDCDCDLSDADILGYGRMTGHRAWQY